MDVDDKPGQALFIKACSGCHSVGKGDRVGPDLDGVTLRRDHSWLTRFISTPDKVIAGKDPIAMELVQKFPGVQMPSIGLSEQDAGDVIAYLAAQSYSLAATKEAAETGGENAHHHHHDE